MSQTNKDSELVLGLITTVGTDTSDVIRIIKEQLRHYNYTEENIDEISVSTNVISQFFDKPPNSSDEYARISAYMDKGNDIRKVSEDNAILMKGVAAYICQKRLNQETGQPEPRKRVAYIIKSLKHPDEVEFMRSTYGDGFHLIGVTSSFKRRLSFLTERQSIPSDQAQELLERDSNEQLVYGQHTQDAFQQADYFINCEGNSDSLTNNIERLLDLLFGNPFISPTFEEYAMFMAYTTSLRSADLSRQIGAVIAKNDEILASGTNDCPKYGGGLYWPIEEDNKYVDVKAGRDHTLGYDSNKFEQNKIINNILDSFKLEKSNENKRLLKESGINALTEYGRVVHAEMEAILMCSRNNISCKGATLYATTFPCHNCAKHIIAAGIKKVVFIEPYPKSKALDFYKTEITESIEESNKVQFIHFVGVGPRRFVDLFSVTSTRSYAKKRKDNEGNKLEWKQNEANLRNPMSLLTYIDIEKSALVSFIEELEVLKEELK